MNIAAATWLPYRLPLARPWVSAAGTWHSREGWLLRLDTDDGRKGWGDCAPFPAIGISEPLARRYAKDCARLDLAAQANGLPLADWLAGGPAARSIAVNAAVGDISRLDQHAADEALAAGFKVLKLKVGGGNPTAEIARLRTLSARLPADVTWRLDANGAWDEETAASFLGACVQLPVECCEEPLASPSLPALARLQGQVPFPLAVDESFHLVGEDFFSAPPVQRLVLKPPRHGGLEATLALARQAARAGLECVVTSSLESTCGLLAAAHLAAAIAPNRAHGLATASWFTADTGQPPVIADGRLHLPPGPGLGFQPAIS